MKHNSPITNQEQAILEDALYYLKMQELKKACSMLNLPESGKKIALINRIITFVKTGSIIQSPSIPAQSRALHYPRQSLTPTSLMLYGAYKNDAQTRAFFKKLIGAHFHFTAFGIDWLNERWLASNPPTYQEFADFWNIETARRKQEGAAPKDEWRFIRFIQQMRHEHPDASKEDLMHAWKQVQARNVHVVYELIRKISHIQ